MATEKKPENYSDLHILLVDDEPEILEITSFHVESMGFHVLTAKDGEEALDLAVRYQSKLALIVSDYTMPKLTGFEFRAALLEAKLPVPFLILSSHVDREIALQAMELQISAFLEKPFDEKKLIEFIEKYSRTRIANIREEEDLLNGFVEDAFGIIEQLEPLILEIEHSPTDLELINKLFGFVHTLKGASGFFQPSTLHNFVHKFEDLISKVKNNSIAIEAETISVFLKGIGILEQLLNELRIGQHQPHNLANMIEIFDLNRIKNAQASNGPAIASTLVKAKGMETKKDLRVSVDLLDEFMQISSEMTVIKNMLDKVVRSIDRTIPGNKDVTLLNDLIDETHKINCSIQAKIIEIRKVTIKSITKTLPRTVRDLALKLNKEVEFTIEGDDLRVDAAVGEVLSNSLIHMVRNSLDHGLETPEIRKQKGKFPQGKLQIIAKIKGDDIVVEIADDGAGISVERIKE